MILITNLLTNMVVIGALGFLPKQNYSRPAFQEYAFTAMFQQASNLAATWHLDLPHPLTTNLVTSFSAVFYVDKGIRGGIEFNKRFSFGWDWGKLISFDDQLYTEGKATTSDVDANTVLLENWMRATNFLTMSKARVIAESAMRSVVVTEDKSRFKSPDHMIQKFYTWKDGKDYPIPLYRFRWGGTPGWPDYEIQVSGISSNVSHCFFVFNSPFIEPLKPTNYFGLLGLPSNPIFMTRHSTAPGEPMVYEYYTNYLRNVFPGTKPKNRPY